MSKEIVGRIDGVIGEIPDIFRASSCHAMSGEEGLELSRDGMR